MLVGRVDELRALAQERREIVGGDGGDEVHEIDHPLVSLQTCSATSFVYTVSSVNEGGSGREVSEKEIVPAAMRAL